MSSEQVEHLSFYAGLNFFGDIFPKITIVPSRSTLKLRLSISCYNVRGLGLCLFNLLSNNSFRWDHRNSLK